MNKTEIGKAAGVVWRTLSEKTSLTYDEFKDKCNMNDRLLNAAIGWLAREDKLEIEYDGKRQTDVCHLKYYHMYF